MKIKILICSSLAMALLSGCFEKNDEQKIILNNVPDIVAKGDHHKGIDIIRKGAEQGYTSDQYLLGLIYSRGIEMPQDYQLAATWFGKAAAQGHDLSQINLGWMYSEGKGVAQDHQKAVYWFRKAAEQGNDVAQFVLGQKYERGEGVKQDSKLAYVWYSVSVANSSKDSDNEDLAKIRNAVAKKLTPEELNEAQKLAAKYFKLYPAKQS